MGVKKITPLHVGDTLTLKKPHPCGSDRFRVMRTGSDIRIICEGCGRDLTLPREKLERAIRSTDTQGAPEVHSNEQN